MMDVARRGIGSKGQAIVEWAVILPVILLLTLGILQMGLVLVAKVVVNHAAFSAARAALVVETVDETDSRSWEERAGEEARRAAEIVCAPVAGTVSDATATPIRIPGWGDVRRSENAPEKLRLIHPDDLPETAGAGSPVLRDAGTADARVRVDLQFDVELWFPLFPALLPRNLVVERGGIEHFRLTETCTLARPWE